MGCAKKHYSVELSAMSYSNASLSTAQKRIWFESQSGNASHDHVVLTYELKGDFSFSILQQALSQLVAENDIFRTTIFSAGKNLERFVHEKMKVELTCLHLEPETDLYPTIQHLVTKPFNISAGPLFRFILLQRSPKENIFLLIFHRLIINTCVLKKIMKEISEHYRAIFNEKVSLIEKKPSYDDLVSYERKYRGESRYRETIRHWSNRVKDKQFHLDLTRLSASEENPSHVRAQRLKLDKVFYEKIKYFCDLFSCTPETVFLSILQALLYRYTDSDDIVVNRVQEITYQENWQNLIGPTGNILPWNVRLDANMNFLTLLKHNQQFDSYKKYYSDAHITDIVRTVRSRFNHHFDGFFSNIAFEQEFIPFHEFVLPHVTVRALPQYIHRIGREELQVFFDEYHQHFSLSFDYVSTCSSKAVQHFVEHYKNFLDNVLQDPLQKLSQINFLSADTIEKLLGHGIEASVTTDITTDIVTLFEEAARRYPNYLAVVDEKDSLTYQQLNEASNQLAHALEARHLEPDTRIGLAIGRNVRLVIATLGILKARAAYVPLDPSYPKERLTYMIQDANISLVITEKKTKKKIESFIQSGHSVEALLLDKKLTALTSFSADNCCKKPDLQDLAYVIYTSGSTGKPKGVLVPHRGVSNLALYQKILLALRPKKKCLQAGSINFDISAFELFAPLIFGCCLYIANDEQRRAPLKLQAFIADKKIEVVTTTPSVLAQFEWIAMPNLRVITVCGEPCEQKLMDFWAHGRKFINGYGPTEITMGSHFKVYEPNTLFNNLGPVVPHVNAFILDSHKNLLPDGVPGELYIGGAGVARGYLNLPEQTADKFIQNPFRKDDILYRTNDIAYRLENGDFMYLGRNDDQIKIRGLRVELGEIEAKIKTYPDIERVLVRAISHDTLGKVLVAYFIQNSLKKTIGENTLREYTQSFLPEHMVPAYFIKVPHFPIMRNGKIDYQSLPNPFVTSTHFDHEQCSKIEQTLVKIFAELFHTDKKSISLEHDFFALGGHSLLATQMIARIQQYLNLQLPVGKVFELRTIKKFAEYLSTLQKDNSALPLICIPDNTPIPLSYSQRMLWFFFQLDKESPLYNIPFLIRFKNANRHHLIRAFHHVIEQNAVLRTVFEETEDEPVQRTLPALDFKIPIYESSDVFHREIEIWDKTAFDLLHGPLFRAAITQEGDNILLYFNVHHIIFDGWSLKVFINQLAKTYQAIQEKRALPSLKTTYSYADFIYSQRQWVEGEKLTKELHYWQNLLQGATTSLDLPTDFPYPKQKKYAGNAITIVLPPALTDSLKTLALENQTTLFSVLLTAYFILFYRYTKQSDILIGTPIANRIQAELEPIIGFMVNVSIYRQQLSNEKTFYELLHAVHQNACDAADNQALPFDVLLNSLDILFDPKKNPLFQVMFSLQTGHQLSGTLGEALIQYEVPYEVQYEVNERHAGGAKADMLMALNEMPDGGLQGYVEYRTDLFTEASILHVRTHFNNLLHAIVDNTTASIAELTILSYEEYQLLVNTWPYGEKKPIPEKTVLEKIEETVNTYGDLTALNFHGEMLSYKTFWQRVEDLSEKIQGKLDKQSDKTETIIGILLPRGQEMIIAMCAIWKVGAAFLPLDADYPEERVRYMLEDSGAEMVVTMEGGENTDSPLLSCVKPEICIRDLKCRDARGTRERISECSVGHVLCVKDFPLYKAGGRRDFFNKIPLHSLAYLIYTSGSTGNPKGVALEHLSLSNVIHYVVDLYHLQPNTRVLQFTSINFDASIKEIFSALVAGACLYIVDSDMRRSPEKLQAFIETQKIQLASLQPVVLESFEKKPIPGLEIIDVGGDACDPNTINFWRNHCRLLNTYGPTETTIICSTKHYDEPMLNQNIGRPLYNTEMFILDEELNPVPTGVIGELFVGGICLARGYWNQEQLTLEKFILHPFSDDPNARLYRTGDYARWLPNGELDFIGRIDNQVKIRGYRIEIGEIETRLNAYPAIKQAVVIAKKEQQILVAYFTCREDVESEKLKEYLAEIVPEYMIPAAFIPLETLPLNLSGKIDRKALQAQDFRYFNLVRSLVEPANEMEKTLCHIWKDVLKIEALGVENSFFELGGHSLLITKMISRIKKHLKLNLSIAKVFELLTIRKIAAHLMTLQEESKGTLVLWHAPEKNKAPLSYAQKQMWFFYQLNPNSVVYNIPMLLRFKNVNPALLIQSFYHVIEQNPIFHTVIDNTEEEPIQIVLSKRNINFPIYDALDRFKKDIALWDSMPFDLVNGPLFRLAGSQEGQDTLIYFNVHHMAFDAWSTNILLHQVTTTYFELERNKSAPKFSTCYTYQDYAYSQHRWIKENRLKEQLAFWQHFLQDAQTIVDLPTDFPYPAKQTFAGKTMTFSVSPHTVDALRKLASDHHTTLFAVTLSAFFTLLYRYTRQSDLIIGVPTAGRYHAALEPIIGFFVNESLYRQTFSQTKTFRELLASVHQNACDAMENQALPFNEILDTLNIPIDPTKNPLFQVLFNYLSLDFTANQESGLGLDYRFEERTHQGSKLDITLSIGEMPDGSIQGGVEYRTDLFTELSIQHLCAHYQHLLQDVIQNQDVPLGSYRILSEPEYDLLVHKWPYGKQKPLPEKTALEMIEEAVQRDPHAPALIFDDRTLTYAEFWTRVGNVNAILRDKIGHSVAPPIVGILMPRGVEMIIAMCAIWKLGAAFLPLDTDYPDERLNYMVKDSDTSIIVSVSGLKEKQDIFKERDVVFVWMGEDVNRELDVKSPQRAPLLRGDFTSKNNIAYIIYTSGSTGNPKGVVVKHQGISNLIPYLQDIYHLKPGMKVLQFTSINFDVSMAEILPSLASGASLYIANGPIRRSVSDLQHYIHEKKIQLVSIPPAVLEHFEKKPLPNLETLIIAGDTCSPAVIDYWKKQCRLINGYGPTEATVYALTKLYGKDTSPQNIGHPLYNSQTFILDDDLHPVPTGVMGEMFIGGAGLAQGYLNREELTQEKFIPHPFSADPNAKLYRTGDYARWLPNGEIEFIGRIDNQVKIRGYRIEIGEIETRLNEYPSIKQAVVIAKKEQQILVAYFSAKQAVESQDLRSYLAEKLPEYMIPAAFILLKELPLSLSGKIDRQQLEKKDFRLLNHIQLFQKPTNFIEKTVWKIWAEILKTDQFGIDNSFFELGGHSLLVTQMISRIKKHLKLHLPIAKIFEYKTIQRISNYLFTLQKEFKEKLSLSRAPNKNKAPLSYAQQQMWFFYQLNPDSSVYHIPIVMRLKKAEPALLIKALHHIIEQHAIFRTVIDDSTAEVQQMIVDKMTFSVPLYSSTTALYKEAKRLDTMPFDLVHGPVFRAAVAQDKKGSLLYFNIHHIAFDGWSVNLFQHQLVETYLALEKHEPLPSFKTTFEYSDYAYSQAKWLEKDLLSDQVAFWQHILQDAQMTLDLPTDFPYPQEQKFTGKTYSFRVERSIGRQLKSLAITHHTTLFAVTLAAFFALLYRYTKQEDIIIGAPIAGRYFAALEPIMGFFVNESVYRQTVSNTKTFGELLTSVHQNVCDAADNQMIPFNHIIDSLPIPVDPKKNPLFQVMFNYQVMDPHVEKNNVLGVSIEARTLATAKLDLTLSLTEMPDGSMQGAVEYRTDLFTALSIQHLCSHYQHVLQEIVANPNAPLGSYRILSNEEYEFLVKKWPYGKKVPLPAETVVDMIEEKLLDYANFPALVFGDQSLTYLDFWAKVECLSEVIRLYLPQVESRESRESKERIVGMLMPRGIEMIIAMCAIWKAGAAFLPLDADYPNERLHYMVADSGTHMIVSVSGLKEKQEIFEGREVRFVWVDEDVDIDGKDNEKSPLPPIVKGGIFKIAYVIYTSGSTGNPKGVAIPHQGVVNLTQYLHDVFQVSPKKHVLQFSSINFDAAIAEIFAALTAGSTLFIADDDTRRSIDKLQDFIHLHRIQTLLIPPAALTLFSKKRFPHLETVAIGGDACESRMMTHWRKQCRLINCYGPTEASVMVSSKLSGSDTHHQNIGYPAYNTEIFILDEDLHPVPTGVMGEMLIGGLGLAQGYLNREELTQEKFISHPFSDDPNARLYRTGDYGRWLPNGEIEFIGRMDNQVKIRGYRIETGEIETRLNTYPGVKQSVVIAKKEQQILVAYFSGKKSIKSEQLQRYLGEKFPDYMIPAAFIHLASLPLNLSDKIDRKQLASRDFHLTTTVKKMIKPRNEQEKQLLTIWKDILKLDQIGVEDSFFDLGGHSLLASRVSSMFKATYHKDCPVSVIFQHKTIAAIVKHLHTTTDQKSIMLADIREATHLLDNLQLPDRLPAHPPQVILMTGGHGFLGAHILEKLLQHMPDASIVCLVRAHTKKALQQKVKHDLARFNLALLHQHPRIQWIKGDLNKPMLGLQAKTYHTLCETVDSIYHAGAWVNHILNYQNLRATNVESTLSLLKMSATHHLKTLNYISTINVKDLFEHPDSLEKTGGYVQSKWVSESILNEAQKRGIPTRIFRPGNITGHSKTGVCVAENNHALSLVKSCIQLGIAPDWEYPVEMMPVDYVSEAIIRHSLIKGRTTIDLNNINILPWKTYMQYLNKLGLNVQLVSFVDWQDKLQAISEENALFPFKDFYLEKPPEAVVTNTESQESEANEAIYDDMLHEVGLHYPREYQALVKLYWAYLKKVGFL